MICAVLLGSLSTPASAQSVCLERDKLVEILESRYGEHPAARGLDATNKMIEVYASSKGTWTLVAVDTGKKACVIATGEAWEIIPPESDKSSWRDS